MPVGTRLIGIDGPAFDDGRWDPPHWSWEVLAGLVMLGAIALAVRSWMRSDAMGRKIKLVRWGTFLAVFGYVTAYTGMPGVAGLVICAIEGAVNLRYYEDEC